MTLYLSANVKMIFYRRLVLAVFLLIILPLTHGCASYTSIRAAQSLKSQNTIKEIAIIGGASILYKNGEWATVNLSASRTSIEHTLHRLQQEFEKKGYRVVYAEPVGVGYRWPVFKQNWYSTYDNKGYIETSTQIYSGEPAYEYPVVLANDKFRRAIHEEYERINKDFVNGGYLLKPSKTNFQDIHEVTGGDTVCLVFSSGVQNIDNNATNITVAILSALGGVYTSNSQHRNKYNNFIYCSNLHDGGVVYSFSKNTHKLPTVTDDNHFKDLLALFPSTGNPLNKDCKLINKVNNYYHCPPIPSQSPYNNDQLDELHIAAKYGDLEKVNKLIADRIDVNSQSGKYEDTPLMLAIDNGHRDIAITLLNHGAEINKFQRYGVTALHKAVNSGQIDITKELILRGADVNALLNKYEKTGTPLHWAARRSNGNSVKMAKLLMENGANLNSRTEKGSTPLHWTYNSDEKGIAQFFINEGADVNATTDGNETPLHSASIVNNYKLAEILINNGAHINIANKYGLTPLHIAIYNGSYKTAVLLLNHDANINASTNIHETPLHYAAKRAGNKIAMDLIVKGARINLLNNMGYTPLHTAAGFGNAHVAKLLLQFGANIHSTDKNESTPLHIAARYRNKNVINLLLKRGANTKVRDYQNYLPVDYIEQEEDPELYYMLNK